MRREDVYRGFASLLRAGVVIGEAADQLHRNGTLPGELGRDVSSRVRNGKPLAEALGHHPDTFPGEDIALVEAGETTGRLVENLERVADMREERRRSLRTLMTAAAYPLLLLHFAAALIPVAKAGIDITLGGWLWAMITTLGPVYAIGFGIWYLNKQAAWRERFRRVLDLVPGYGAAARHHRRSVFATVLGAAYESGIPVNHALSLAGRATHEQRADTAAVAVAGGQPLAAALVPTGIFPPRVLTQLASAEQAGELSETLAHIAEEESDQASHIFKRAIVVTGVLAYVLVAGWIAWFVISFYVNLYSF